MGIRLVGILVAAAMAAAVTGGATADDKDRGSARFAASLAGFAGLGSISPNNPPFDAFGGESRILVPLGDGAMPTPGAGAGVRRFWSLQGDALFESWKFNGGESLNIAGLIAHLTYSNIAYHRSNGQGVSGARSEFNLDRSWRAGAFGGLMDAETATRHVVAGVEAQAYFGGNIQIEGRLTSYAAENQRLVSAYGTGRAFIGPDFYLQASASLGRFADGALLGTLSGRFEYKFARSPTALFLEFNWGWHGDVFSTHDGRAGVRFLFGEPTLRADMVKGASFGRELSRPLWLALQ